MRQLLTCGRAALADWLAVQACFDLGCACWGRPGDAAGGADHCGLGRAGGRLSLQRAPGRDAHQSALHNWCARPISLAPDSRPSDQTQEGYSWKPKGIVLLSYWSVHAWHVFLPACMPTPEWFAWDLRSACGGANTYINTGREGCMIAALTRAGGSGSAYIYGFCDKHWRASMSEADCHAFVRRAVSHAMARDGSSGGARHQPALVSARNANLGCV